MKLFAIIFSLFFVLSSHAMDVSFEAGSDFEAVSLRGSAVIYCSTGSGNISHINCSKSTLTPEKKSYLRVSNGSIDADKVTLTVYHEDGSSRSKTSKYLSSEGRSKKAFNLWTKSLFSRPLLEYGHNTVTYKFTKSGSVVSEGEFSVMVNEGQRRSCPYGKIYSNDEADCTISSRACAKYFKKYSNCL